MALELPRPIWSDQICRGMQTKHEHIANTLTDEILSGRYRPGDRLPSERELCRRFAVGRTRSQNRRTARHTGACAPIRDEDHGFSGILHSLPDGVFAAVHAGGGA